MSDFDYSKNFWPRWRDYVDLLESLFKTDRLTLRLEMPLEKVRDVFKRNVGIRRAVNPMWHHIVTDTFDGTNVIISPNFPNLFKVLKFFHQIPRFRGVLTSDDDATLIQGDFGCTLISRLFNGLSALCLLVFQLLGILITAAGVAGKEPTLLFIGPLWIFLIYIMMKFYLMMLQVPKVHQKHIKEYIELITQEV